MSLHKITARLKDLIKKVLDRPVHIRKLKEELTEFRSKMFVPPGHYYSPIPSAEEIRARQDQIFAPPQNVH
jgi:hypothetical protein